jgi:hypothetical protein
MWSKNILHISRTSLHGSVKSKFNTFSIYLFSAVSCKFVLFFHNFQIKFFWLFWTISPKRMVLTIWYGAFIQALTLGYTSRPLAGLCVYFGSIWGCPNGQKQHKNTSIFWLVWTISAKRMGLMIWLGA